MCHRHLRLQIAYKRARVSVPTVEDCSLTLAFVLEFRLAKWTRVCSLRHTENKAGEIDVRLNGTSIGVLYHYYNQSLVHHTLPPRMFTYTGLAKGTHTISLVVNAGTTDANDCSQVMILEFL